MNYKFSTKKELNIFQLICNIGFLELSIYLLVFLLLILNDGISLSKFPLTSLPIGESLIGISFFIYFLTDKTFLKQIRENKYLLPYIILLLSTLIGVILNINNYGIFTLRSATHVFDMSILFIGIKFGKSANLRKLFFKIFPLTLFVGSIYMLTFPFKDILLGLSPNVVNLRGELVPALFNYANTPVLSINFFAYYLLKPKIPYKSIGFWIAIFSIFITIFLYSKRLHYLLLIILLLIYLINNRQSLNLKSYLPLILIPFIFYILISLDLNFISNILNNFDFIKKNFLSGFKFFDGKYSYEFGNYSGANLRLLWWLSALQKVFESPFNIIFGLGQGITLTDFINRSGNFVSELHNSYLSIFIRNGLLGFIPFIYIKWNLFKSLWRRYVFSNNKYISSSNLTLLFFFTSISAFSFFQPALEKPYFAIPYYFFWGILVSDRKLKFNSK